MQPDYKASLEFLEQWCPGGPWVLTAISLDKKSIETRTFRDPKETKEWLEKQGADRNIYFSVNSTRYDVSKKPMREDVKSLDWLHVDIDPRAGEDIDTERKRALAILQEPPNGLPKPTAIVFSGGGYQGFWRLLEPKEINGEEPLYEDAKRYNQALELAFGADNCHNVDRIMRLPGTLNRPDAKKRKKGRTVQLAKLVEWHDDRTYPLSAFTPAPAVQAETTGFGLTNKVQVSGNIKRLDDVNDLPDKVSDLCKVVIVQGNDPDNPNRFPSRSEALFFVCCELVRGGVDDDTIFSILTDPDFQISSSVLDKGARNAEKYAIRQIERAREDAIDPLLREMNEQYAVVRIGGKTRVVYEEWDEILERHRLCKCTFEDFRNMHMNRKVQQGQDAQGNPRFVPLGKWWLEHEDRRQYKRVIFAPEREVTDAFNMWRGYATEPVPGNAHQPFLDHIHENVCGGDSKLFDYVVGWLANTVQHPDRPGYTALVLRGDQGVGKGFLARTFGRLFGRHFLHVSNAQHLTGNFNAHLRDCVVLFCDEAFYAGDRKHASTLKTLVTEHSIMVEPKGIDTEMVANCLHIIMASNEDWVVPAGYKERRFCVLDVGEAHMQDNVYFGKIAQAMKNGGFSSLLQMLMAYDLSKFDVRKLPQTKALQDQKVHSFENTHDWWYNKLLNGKLLAEHEKWYENVPIEELIADFVDYTRQFGSNRRGSATRLGRFLNQACPAEYPVRWQAKNTIVLNDRTIQRPYYYRFPSLEELRDWWDKKFGGPYDWPKCELVDDDGKEEKLAF